MNSLCSIQRGATDVLGFSPAHGAVTGQPGTCLWNKAQFGAVSTRRLLGAQPDTQEGQSVLEGVPWLSGAGIFWPE